MNNITDNLNLKIGSYVVANRDCHCSGAFVQKSTVGKVYRLGMDRYGFYAKRQLNIGGDISASVDMCGASPRFRLAYKNEEKLWYASSTNLT